MTKSATDHKGQVFPSIEDMCRHWKITSYTFDYRRKLGWSLKDILETPIGGNPANSKKATDHKGQVFPSIKTMCRHWGISRATFESRSRLGWSLKDTLETPAGNLTNSKKATDHKGQVFPSIKAMCRHWGISRATFERRSRLGWSLKDTLETPAGNLTNSKKATDHKGQVFISIEAMCRHWGISRTTFESRSRLGWSLKDILEKPVGNPSIGKEATDHKGQVFPSIEAMCRHWKITPATFYGRQKLGWGLKDILEKPVDNPAIGKETTDHKGQVFPSVHAMCRHWGISRATFYNRSRLGWDLKDILEKPIDNSVTGKETIDHKGQVFPSLEAMCRHWKMSPATFAGRRKMGWSLRDSLETPVKRYENRVTKCAVKPLPLGMGI